MSAAVTNALAALEAQVVFIESLADNATAEETDEIVLLCKENEELRREIAELKQKVFAADLRSGKGPQPTMTDAPAQGKGKGKNAAQKEPAAAVAAPAAAASKPKKEKKEKKAKEPATPAAPVEVDVRRLDMRVGVILSVKRHPDADSLYIEEIDVGEEAPRQVVSGLVKWVTEEEMSGRKLIVMCNLQPAKMRGVTSSGMVMCASTPDKVELIEVPASAKPGDKVLFEGYPAAPETNLKKVKKIWEAVAPELHTNADRIAMYRDTPFTINGEKCFAPSLPSAPIK